MSQIMVFSDLKQYIESNPIPPLTGNVDTNMYESNKNFLDFVALHYLPSDAPDSYAPVKVIRDGNCFPRSVSFVVFHMQNKHAEIRTCIVYESVVNMGFVFKQHILG